MKKILILALVLLASGVTHANGVKGLDSLTNKKRSLWIPDFAKLQYAGGLGMFSVHGGYNFGKRRQHELDLGFGFKPEEVRGSEDIQLLSVGYQLSTIKPIELGKGWSIDPLTVGITYIFYFDQYLDDLKDGFPEGYYFLRNDQTLQLGLEASVTKRFKKGKTIKGMTAYFNANQDLVYLLNTYRSFRQEHGHLISLGCGVVFHFEL
ncbi:hypothetical protein FUAX_11240 [Fulvitalea axinellae]|uniref:Outer membrane protein beta-barrel domain-containing protein n=1 Tax=Fulvitalea axinellae TaxID=1182444 RepID=A0AAU9CTG0_9BACT|nr:hypothetical protein FUAX_11240 [Fulvitalea axinellae]